ncbi:hypothetical protein N0V90_003567 [Kalmusia sp. IMI 367209]|nr:hypothetical protein N0V90_003567 [Kalmusia sp. IMI 367209]
MSEKNAAPAVAKHDREDQRAMSSPRALLTLAAFLALPLGFVYIMSHCNHFTPSAMPTTSYRHPHSTTQAKQSLLDNIGKALGESTGARPTTGMRFCSGENLKDCTEYAIDGGCTRINEKRVLSMAEPRMFEGSFSACTVFRRGVHDCEIDAPKPDSFKHVKEFVVNWEVDTIDKDYARNGVVPLIEREWISDIGSFRCW